MSQHEDEDYLVLAVADLGGFGRPSFVQMKRTDKMLVNQLGLKTLK